MGSVCCTPSPSPSSSAPPPRVPSSSSTAPPLPSSSSSSSSSPFCHRHLLTCRCSSFPSPSPPSRPLPLSPSSSSLSRSFSLGRHPLLQEEPSLSSLLHLPPSPTTTTSGAGGSSTITSNVVSSSCYTRSASSSFRNPFLRDVYTRDCASADTLSSSTVSMNETLSQGHAQARIASSSCTKNTGSLMPSKDMVALTIDNHLGFSPDWNSNREISCLLRSDSLHKQTSYSQGSDDSALTESEELSAMTMLLQSFVHQVDAGHKDWSMQTSSQLMASSQIEGFGTLSMNMKSLGEKLPLSSKRTQVTSTHNFGDELVDLPACSICFRLLIQQSPWSSNRMLMGNSDLPAVGVLVCGHIFHADCLEKAVPDALKHDPPCPECNQVEVSSLKPNKPSGFSGLKDAASKPIKNKLSKIAPQIWKGPSWITRASTNIEPDQDKKLVNSYREWSIFNRSMSRKPLSSYVKSSKELPTHSFCSKKFGSLAQILPESQP